ncbi:MAG TPA: caspase family protein, partial [Vicinamibacteria bacterium]|nr:caspase family protein [Vicinamibacteria bacterium]
MSSLRMPVGPALVLALLALAGPARAQGQRHALLVGVGAYTHGVPALEGPPYDIAALKKALTDRWGFPAGNVKVLLDGQATRANILAAVDDLSRSTRPNDFVFVYFSGHGTSTYENSDLGIDGNSGAVVPADFDLEAADPREGLIVGSRDLRPRLEKIDKDRQVFVAFDSCYSGAAVRSLRAVGKPRFVALPRPGGTRSVLSPEAGGDPGAAPAAPYPYQNVIYISAASKAEAARDVTSVDIQAGRARTVDGNPHGAFTNALLEGLGGAANTNRDRMLTYGELYQYVRDTVSQSFPHQPQLLAPAARQEALLGQGVLGPRSGTAAAPQVAPSRGQAAPRPLEVKVENLPPALAQKVLATRGVAASAGTYDLLVARERDGYRLYHGSGDLLAAYDASQS